MTSAGAAASTPAANAPGRRKKSSSNGPFHSSCRIKRRKSVSFATLTRKILQYQPPGGLGDPRIDSRRLSGYVIQPYAIV